MRHSNVAFFIPHIGCPNKCSFCNQNSISGANDIPRKADVISVLSDALNNMDVSKLKNSEIAFFGGSFTAIDRTYMIELLSAAKKFVGEDMFGGIRISTRPDAINDEILALLKEYNVTAIELGAQSMDDEVLDKNFRGHNAEDVIKASKLIREYGFSLGLQMMTGLYCDTPQKSIETAYKIADLKPDTVRIYPTVVIRNTYLEKIYNEGKYVPLGIDETVSLCTKLLDFFEERNINVIRIGLHDQESLKQNFVAGAYHPALGELILGERMFKKTISLLREFNVKTGEVKISLNPKSISRFIGQNKRNVIKLSEQGYNVKLFVDDSLNLDDIKLI